MPEEPQVASAKAEVRSLVADAESVIKRAEAAIERWYAAHFHRAVSANTQPITATEKADLHAAVSAAIASSKE